MRKSAILKKIHAMSESELVTLHNEYCESIGYDDDHIYENDEEFFNTFFANNPNEVARATFYGDYNYSHKYVFFNGYGNLETLYTFTLENLEDTPETIADDVIENPNNYNLF